MSVILERRRSHARKRHGSVIAGGATAALPWEICILTVHYKRKHAGPSMALLKFTFTKYKLFISLCSIASRSVSKKIKQLYHKLKQNNRLSMSDILCSNNFVGQHIDIKINHCIKPEFGEIVNGKGEKYEKNNI